MTALTRFLRRRREKDYKNGEQQSKLYRTITNVAIIGTFLACGILVLALFKMFAMTSTIFGIVATIAIVSIACLMLLPWIRIYEKGEFKKTAIVFMIFIAVKKLASLTRSHLFVFAFISIDLGD